MDAIIIVGIISAVVSVLSLLGNIYIARQNIRSSEKIIELETISSIQKEQRQAFNDFEKQAELLRIRCWGLIGWEDQYARPDDEFSIAVYKESVRRLLKQGENLRVRWASIKAELPNEVEGYTRKLWHDCNNKMQVISNNSRGLILNIEKQKPKPSQGDLPFSIGMEVRQDSKSISHALASLLANLDELISISKTVRHTSESGNRIMRT